MGRGFGPADKSMRGDEMPSKNLLAQIHIGKKSLALDDQVYRDMLENITGKRSAAELSDRQVIEVLADMKKKGWIQNPNMRPLKYEGSPRDPYDASGKIKRKIEFLWHSIYRGNDETKHLRQWLFNRFKISDVKFLDKHKAYAAVEALKQMMKRRTGEPEKRGQEQKT